MLISLMLVSVVVAGQEYKSGGIVELYNIEQCEGPVQIKVTSEDGIKADEMRIEKCTLDKNNVWKGTCNGYFNVKLLTPDDTKNVYDFTIQYYTQYPHINMTGNVSPSLQEIERENYLMVEKLTNVIIQPGKPLKRLFLIDGETQSAFFFAVAVFILIVAIGVFIVKKTLIGNVSKNNNDMLNYKVTKDKDLDSDASDVLNEIK